MNITVCIEQLVLDGLPVSKAQAPLVVAAVEAELASLLTVGAPASALQVSGFLPSLSAPALPLSAMATASALGADIARALYAALAGPADSPPPVRPAAAAPAATPRIEATRD